MNWREWEGRTVDGKFVLGNYLGGSDGGAVFRTRVGNGEAGGGPADAAIKLVGLSGAKTESQLRAWKAASELSHPNLIRILASGRAADEVVYVVEEFAEENLAQIIPERALTAEEVRGMLGPVLGALAYVHGKGMVHGRIKPSNILAAGDQVKLSSDSLQRAGQVPQRASPYDAPEAGAGVLAASDVWSLGMTLVEVLTQHAPAWDAARMRPPEIGNGVPEPYRGIARCCLEMVPAKRCGIREIQERLEGKRVEGKSAAVAPQVAGPEAAPGVARASKAATWPYLLLFAVAVVVMLYLILRPGAGSGPEETQTSVPPPVVQSPPPSQGATAEKVQSRADSHTSRSGSTREVDSQGKAKATTNDDIVERVMPKVSASAQRTITGKLKVRVRVKADAAGKVREASLKEAGPSKYFSRVALEAAREWKFAAAQDQGAEDKNREWTLLFVFSRSRTEVSAARSR